MTEPTTQLDRFERFNIRYGRTGLALIALGFPSYAAGIWLDDGRWGWTGLLLQALGLIIWITYIANATHLEKQRKDLAQPTGTVTHEPDTTGTTSAYRGPYRRDAR